MTSTAAGYELDLVKEMAHQRKGNKIAVVYNHDCEGCLLYTSPSPRDCS